MYTRQMLQTHPKPSHKEMMEAIVQCIEANVACAQTCTSCADACLGEEQVAHLRACIRYNLDCADICAATARILTRLTQANSEIIRSQLQACITACRVCGDECEKHADMHEHCRVCGQSCRQCEASCSQLLQLFG